MNNQPNNLRRDWWKETIVYQIYPRSFQDSNGDGIGDLRGIIQRLDYVKDLGVETLWLNPIFKSPNDDNGYDVSDYRDIMDNFGSMADFDALLAEIKKRNLRIILDLVPNHSSDEHFWFKESRKSKNNPYRDYYYWKPPKEDGSPPTNWVGIFAPSTWEYDQTTGEYYLHMFSVKQPDLNWENPKVRQEIYDIMNFWMKKGIDGFRIDVLTFISKDLNFPDHTEENFDGDLGRFFGNGPRLHEFLQEMNREVISKYDMMTVGEGPGITTNEALLYVGEQRKELHTVYHFEHMYLDKEENDFFKPRSYDFKEFKRIVSDWDKLVAGGAWNTAFLGNHDFPRMVSRFGNDKEYRQESAKLLGMFLLTQRATPYIYFGDEIGMTNTSWETLDKFRDIQVFDGHQKCLAAGENEQIFLSNLKHTSRDNARTPMQWDGSKNAGFSDVQSWIDVNPNFKSINVAESEADTDSILNFYKKMIRIRKENEVLVYGDFRELNPEHESLFIYTRNLDKEKVLVILNFSSHRQEYHFNEDIHIKSCLLSNQKDENIFKQGEGLIQPWEASLYVLYP